MTDETNNQLKEIKKLLEVGLRKCAYKGKNSDGIYINTIVKGVMDRIKTLIDDCEINGGDGG